MPDLHGAREKFAAGARKIVPGRASHLPGRPNLPDRGAPVGQATSLLRLATVVPRARLAAKQQGLARKICLWARESPWSDLTACAVSLPHS